MNKPPDQDKPPQISYYVRGDPLAGLDRLAQLFFWGFAAAYFFLFLYHQRIYLQDYPIWAYEGHVFFLKIFGSQDLANYAVRSYPIPNSFITLFLGFLNTFLDPIISSKIAILLYIISGAALLYLFSKRMNKKYIHIYSLLYLSLILISTCFWNGNINFQYSLLAMAGFLLIDNSVRNSLFRVTIILVAGVLIFFIHAVTFSLFIIYVLVRYLILERKIGICLATVPSLLMLFVYSFNTLTAGTSGITMLAGRHTDSFILNIFYYGLYKVYTVAKTSPIQNFLLLDREAFIPKDSPLYYAAVLANLLFVVLLFYIIYKSSLFRRLIDRGGSRFRTALLMCTIISLVILLVAPGHILGVVNIGERYYIIGLMLLIPFLKLESVKRWFITALVAILIFGNAYNIFFLSSSYDITRFEKKSVMDLDEYLAQNYLFTHRPFEKYEFYEKICAGELDAHIFQSGIIYEK